MSSLEASRVHAIFHGTLTQCQHIIGMLKPTLDAQGLTAEPEYRPPIHGKPEVYVVRAKLLPKVAHTIITLSRGGEVKTPIQDAEILEYLGAQEGNLREWMTYVERGLTSFVGKGETETSTAEELEFPGSVSKPHDLTMNVDERR